MRASFHQFVVHGIAVATLVAASGCQSESSDEARDLTLLPAGSEDGVRVAPSLPRRADCVNQFPQRVAIRGTLRREVQLGPPGYGETPTQDRRDTILILVPARSLPVCNDPAIDARGPSVIQADRLQLMGRLDPRRYAPGDSIVAYGGFEQAVWGWHYTPVVMHVDSIVTRRPLARQGSRSSASAMERPLPNVRCS